MTRHEGFDHVIFDWNGTIVDDVGLAVDALNSVRTQSGLACLTVEEYRDCFCFPIESFYSRIGFDFNKMPFANLTRQYLAIFNLGVLNCRTHTGVDLTLAAARQARATTWVLSASHEEILIRDARQRGLYGSFDAIAGLNDSCAAGKMEIALRLDKRLGSPGLRALLIGDTLHDAEIASSRGWSCILVPNGHQSITRLSRTKAIIADSLSDVAAYINPTTLF